MVQRTRVSCISASLLYSALLLLSAVAILPASATDFGYGKFVLPTPDELALKEVPGYPSAPAIVLFREEITRDDLHVVQHYDRVKVLTEEGKKYATVELRYISIQDAFDDGSGDGKTIGGVEGRTIHADGKIIPFTGKPYRNTIEKGKEAKYQALVFTLPDVEVGSILEYRYDTRINDNVYESPSWYIQGDLYLKAAHYAWFPTTKALSDSRGLINSISWFPLLPPEAKIDHREVPGSDSQVYELSVKDIAPQPKEEFMPPIASYSYRVIFNFSSYRSGAEYWKGEGKEWTKRTDPFTTPNADLHKATDEIIAGATTSDQKLRKIYAAIMKFENTAHTREKEKNEEKAAGTGKLNSANDVFKRERGTPTQLTELFVAMAKAAGFKAYLMLVPDRSVELFTPAWLSFNQFDATLAIVNVDGKELFFDPGERDCPYNQLAWQHTLVGGLRQVDGGTNFAQAPSDSYKNHRTARVANLHMNDQGEVTGTVLLSFEGAPALQWRQRSLKGDDESLGVALRRQLESMIPKTLEVTLTQIENLNDFEKPLAVSYQLKGSLGNPTGKRLLVPVNIFEVGSTASFPHDKRELAICFGYPEIMQDAIRVSFTNRFQVEGVPDSTRNTAFKSLVYSLKTENTPSNYTIRRDLIRSEIIYNTKDYADIRKFYTDMESKDREQVVLKLQPVAAANPGGN